MNTFEKILLFWFIATFSLFVAFGSLYRLEIKKNDVLEQEVHYLTGISENEIEVCEFYENYRYGKTNNPTEQLRVQDFEGNRWPNLLRIYDLSEITGKIMICKNLFGKGLKR